MTAALEGGEWSEAHPGRTLPPGKTRNPLYRRLIGPQGRSGRAENLVPSGIRSRTVQPVAQSLYRLNYSAHNIYIYIYNSKYKDLNNRNTESLWNVNTKLIPVRIGATGTVSESFRKYLSNIPGKHDIKGITERKGHIWSLQSAS